MRAIDIVKKLIRFYEEKTGRRPECITMPAATWVLVELDILRHFETTTGPTVTFSNPDQIGEYSGIPILRSKTLT